MSAPDLNMILDGPIIETLLIIMRLSYDKGVAIAGKGDKKSKPVALHHLVHLARLAHRYGMSVSTFKELWQGKRVVTLVGSTQLAVSLNY